MTYRDLYHLNNTCEKVEVNIKQPYIDNDMIQISLTKSEYEDLIDVVRSCKRIINDLFHADIKDVIRRDT